MLQQNIEIVVLIIVRDGVSNDPKYDKQKQKKQTHITHNISCQISEPHYYQSFEEGNDKYRYDILISPPPIHLPSPPSSILKYNLIVEMSKAKQLQKVINQEQSTSNSLLKINLNSIEVEALIAEEQKLVHALKAQQQPSKNSHNTVENLSTVLIQSLTTKDQELINFTLANDDQQLIENTVKALPASKVTQLLESIQQAILGKPYNTHFYSKWLKHLLTIHTTTLLNKSNLAIINNLKGVLSAKTKNIQELSKLKGKLSIVVEQNKRVQEVETKKPKRVIRETEENEEEEKGMEEGFDQEMEIEDLEDLDEEM